MKIITLFILIAALSLAAIAQQTGSIGGQVLDSNGAVIVGATVTAISTEGKEKTVTSNQRGEFSVTGLTPGNYIVRVIAQNFAPFEKPEVAVSAGRRASLDVALSIETIAEQVEVGTPDQVSTDPENNAGATVLKEKDLEALPDDPDELESALQALAGPSAGPNGGQIYIDGFTGGRLPPKEAIREIRINQNPFSAEYERLGFGRIEILTKPGSDKFRGQAFMNFNDESLNSRNPFAVNRAPSQTRFFGGNISGPIRKGKSSYFFDISNRDIDNNAVVNAIVLDPSLNPIALRQEFKVPNRRFSFSPRVDYAINDKNTLVARYEFSRFSVENQGIGDTSLPSRAYNTNNVEHEFRVTETMIINPRTVNETRFSYEFNKRQQEGDISIPTISVPAAFTGGGAQVGLSFNRSHDWEFQNYTTTSFGKNSQHSVKFGVRLRGINITDRSESNFGGTFTFSGIAERRIPTGCSENTPPCEIVPAVTPLDQYRRLLLGDADPRYNFHPTQFSITTGNPVQTVSRTDVGLFATDDWRITPGFTLSFGIRYENQTNINDKLNFAPRVAFAWSPGAGGARAPKTVLRGGFGIFYDRFSEGLTLNARRFNGENQLNLIVNSNDTDPTRRAIALTLLAQPIFTLNGVTNVPTASEIAAVLPASSTIRTVSEDLRSPYTMQAALGVERQLPYRTTVSAFFIGSRSIHVLRARNVNAPICPLQVDCLNAPRPDPALGNIYEYESTGISDQRQFMVNFRSSVHPKVMLFGNYRLGFAKGDSDGAGSFPAYSYDLSGEYGRSSFDIRHMFFVGGNISLPWEISLNPFIVAASGRPFNITKGVDLNGDALFTERPTFAELAEGCARWGISAPYCDVTGRDANAIIPRNYAQGPGSFTVNLRVSKNFGFGGGGETAAATGGGQSGRDDHGGGNRGGDARGGGMRGGPVMMGGGPGGFGGGERRKPYNLNIGINFSNLFNNVNLGTPVGNLASSRFGQSTSISGGFGGFGPGGGGSAAANRRIELQARFSW